MTDPQPLSAEIQILLAAHRPGLVTNCDCEPGQPRWAEHILARAIDAQATEIAALKGALAAVIPWIDGEPRDRAYRMALLRYNDSAGGGTETDVLNELERQRQVVFRAARVLAGKEAQGG